MEAYETLTTKLMMEIKWVMNFEQIGGNFVEFG
jgi:hypothetical protein